MRLHYQLIALIKAQISTSVHKKLRGKTFSY